MKIDANQNQNFLEKTSSKHLNSATAPSNNDADVSLRVNYASLVDEAAQLPNMDASAVQQAQELLLSGRLESPENIQTAAENIITFGI